MKSVDPGVLPQSACFAFSPSSGQRELCFYPTWCGHYFCTADYFKKRQSYHYLLLLYIREGELHVEAGGQSFDARKGDVVLLDCTQPHYYHARDGLEFCYLHFEGSNAHELVRHIREQRGSLIQDESCASIGMQLFDLVQFHRKKGEESFFQTSLRIYKLIERLAVPPTKFTAKEDPVEAAIHYIKEHIGEPISLSSLAEAAHLSPYYFAHRFKKQTGFSPLDYVIHTRINRAKELLLQTSLSVNEIAYEVGYHNGRSLVNLFTQRVGVSPSNFRKSKQLQY